MIDFTKPFCEARYHIFSGWGGCYPRCSLPAGHDGDHKLSYGTVFTDAETIAQLNNPNPTK